MAYEPRYARAHRALREQWKPIVEAGGATCWRCAKPIGARERWDLGHDDDDPSYYRGPEHELCNRGAPHRSPDPEPRIRPWWRS